MASAVCYLKWVGRAVFFALMATQCGFLAAYPAQYNKDKNWYFLSFSYAPAVVIWICLMVCRKADLLQSFFVWAAYVCSALLPHIVIIFGFVVDSLEKERFLGPKVLKMVLCITPLLLLLLVNTADDSFSSDKCRELVAKLSVQMAIDLFDVVEMLDIVLDEKEHKYDISKGYEIAMISVACIGLFLSPLQMAENKFYSRGEPSTRFKTTLIRNLVEMIGVNLAFLVIRVLVFKYYGKDETIFIAKNGIAIILSVLEIGHLVGSHGCRRCCNCC